MGVATQSDYFDHNIAQAMESIVQDFDTKEEFLSAMDAGQEFVDALFEQAREYTDLEECATKVWEERND